MFLHRETHSWKTTYKQEEEEEEEEKKKEKNFQLPTRESLKMGRSSKIEVLYK